MKKYIWVIILVVALLMIGLYVMGKYNSFVKISNEADAQWAQVDSVLQRRFDSIDQAVGGLKIANNNEQEAIKKITDARKIYTAASGNTEAQISAINNYGGALNGLLLSRSAVGEAYPNLKTPDLVGGLIGGVTVEGNENRINVERQRYNEIVREYNNNITILPGSILAKMFGYSKRSYYNLVNPEAINAPKLAPNLDFK
jgi:LemA protein